MIRKCLKVIGTVAAILVGVVAVYVIYLLAKPGDVGDNQYGSPTSYEVITAEESARTGLKETPSESMDQKAMIACLCLWVLNIWISFLSI